MPKITIRITSRRYCQIIYPSEAINFAIMLKNSLNCSAVQLEFRMSEIWYLMIQCVVLQLWFRQVPWFVNCALTAVTLVLALFSTSSVLSMFHHHQRQRKQQQQPRGHFVFQIVVSSMTTSCLQSTDEVALLIHQLCAWFTIAVHLNPVLWLIWNVSKNTGVPEGGDDDYHAITCFQ